MEKSGRLGGTGALSSTLMAVDADLQKEAGYTFDTDNLFEQWMSQVHWYAKGNLIRTFPVSYTHLDVYKRQPWPWVLWLWIM